VTALKNPKAILLWVMTFAYMAFIFYLSSRPALEAARRFPIIYQLKLVHMLEYGILSALLFFSARESGVKNVYEAAAFAIVAALLYGTIDEFHQIFVPGRTAKLMDIVANGIGAAVVQAGATRSYISNNLSLKP